MNKAISYPEEVKKGNGMVVGGFSICSGFKMRN